MLLLLSLLLALYASIPLDPELARKGMLGGVAIVALVLISLAALRAGNLSLAVWSYALPTIIVTVAIRLLNSRASPETAFTTYAFYMSYLVLYVGVFSGMVQVLATTVFFGIGNWAIWAMVKGAGESVYATANTGIINSTMGLLCTGLLAFLLLRIMDGYTKSLEKAAEEAGIKVAKTTDAMNAAREGLHTGSILRITSYNVCYTKLLRGITILTDTKATDIYLEEGRATVVKATGRDGIVVAQGHKAVIVATGGFGASVEMREKYNSLV